MAFVSTTATPLLPHAAPRWTTPQAVSLLAGCTAAALCLAVATAAPTRLSVPPPPAPWQTRLSGPLMSSTMQRPRGVAEVAHHRPLEGAGRESTPEVATLSSRQPAFDLETKGLSGTFRWEPVRGVFETLSRATLVVAALALGWFELKPRPQGTWAMASTVEPNERTSAALKNLESILDNPVEPKSKLTEVASETLKKMPLVVEEGPAPEGTPKSTIASLEALLGVEVPAQPTAPPKPDVPPESPTPKVVVGNPAPEKPAATSPRPFEVRLPFGTVVDEAKLRELQGRVPPEDIQRMKDLLAEAGFRLTLSEDAYEFSRTGFVGGTLFRGQIASTVADVVKDVQQRARQTFGDRYQLLVIPEPPRYDEAYYNGASNEKVPAFLLVMAAETSEKPFNAFQYGLAALLALATASTVGFFAFGTGLAHMPTAEIRAFFETTDMDALTELLQRNAGTILSAAIPVGLGVLGTTAAHEAGHRLVARKYGVKLGLPYLLPSTDIGAFSAINRFRSMVPDRTTVFDIAAAGPAAGAAASLLLFLAGLALTSAAPAGDPALVFVPVTLFQTSFFLGSVLKGVAGGAVPLQVHPLVLAGWGGLLSSALSALPIGNTDGGRIAQMVIGAGRKQVASLLVLIGLAFNALAPGLGNNWGLLAAFFMGGTERKITDQFTPLDPVRRNLGTLMVILATLLLVPFPLVKPL
eukprot:EG_transcript_3441